MVMVPGDLVACNGPYAIGIRIGPCEENELTRVTDGTLALLVGFQTQIIAGVAYNEVYIVATDGIMGWININGIRSPFIRVR